MARESMSFPRQKHVLRMAPLVPQAPFSYTMAMDVGLIFSRKKSSSEFNFFVYNQQSIGFLNGCKNHVFIQRRQAPEIKHFDIHSPSGQWIGGHYIFFKMPDLQHGKVHFEQRSISNRYANEFIHQCIDFTHFIEYVKALLAPVDFKLFKDDIFVCIKSH
jgi:hypothetical protein